MNRKNKDGKGRRHDGIGIPLWNDSSMETFPAYFPDVGLGRRSWHYWPATSKLLPSTGCSTTDVLICCAALLKYIGELKDTEW